MVVPISGRLHANSGHALRAAALPGAGIVMVPVEFVDDDPAAGRFVRLSPDHEGVPLSLHLLTVAGQNANPTLRTLIEWVVARLN